MSGGDDHGEPPEGDAPDGEAGPEEPGPGSFPRNVIQLHPRAPEAEPEPEPAESLTDEPGELQAPPEHLLDAAVEALLFAAEGPVSARQLDNWLGNPGVARIKEALHGLELHLRRMGGGIVLARVAKGWQLRTDPRFGTWVAAMRGGKPMRLSRAALETLSIVAYRQPVTRSELEDLRGVDSGGVLRMLCERELCTVLGRKDMPGRPLIYGTTDTFLSLFGLRDLSDLPTLRDLRELEFDDPRGDLTGDQLELPLEPAEEEALMAELEALGEELGLVDDPTSEAEPDEPGDDELDDDDLTPPKPAPRLVPLPPDPADPEEPG